MLKIIKLFVFTALFISLNSNSMQNKKKWYEEDYKQMKVEAKAKLSSPIGGSATIIAHNIIEDIGIVCVVSDKDFYSKSDKAEKILKCWCKENPSTCEEMKSLLPYALRYQSVKEIENLRKVAVRSYNNTD